MGNDTLIAFGGLAVTIIAMWVDMRIRLARIEHFDEFRIEADKKLDDYGNRIIRLESRRRTP
jgi:hypothetical protein